MRSKRRLVSKNLVFAWALPVCSLACADDGSASDDEVGSETSAGDTDTTGGEDTTTSGDTTTDTTTGDTGTDTDTTADTTTSDTTTDTGTDDTTTTTGGELGEDYSMPGPFAVDSSTASMQVNDACNLEYGIFEPAESASEIPVLLAHGFMRSIDDMAPTAEHFASWGLTVYTVPLCTNSFSIDHQLNGEAMAALGQALAPGGAVYSGFSAGGLAAFVAAASDPNAVAFVGLDAVDNMGLADGLAGSLDVPVRGAIAEPGQCNTNNNFTPVYAKLPAAPVIKIVGAEHFDFETDACAGGDIGCTFCAPAGPATRALALGMSTAGVLVETGADAGGDSWWQPGGEYFDMYAQDGQIQLVQ